MSTTAISDISSPKIMTTLLGISLLIGTVSEVVAIGFENYSAITGINANLPLTLFLIGNVGFALGLLGLVTASKTMVSKVAYTIAFTTFLAYAVLMSMQIIKLGYPIDPELPAYFGREFNNLLTVNAVFIGFHFLLATSLIVGGIMTMREKALGRWSVVPLLLGLWLFIHEILVQFTDIIATNRELLSTRYALFLPIVILFGCIGIGMVTVSENSNK